MDNTLTIWDAKFYFKNFSGEEGLYNKKGDRNFGVFINDEDAERLKADGWNVKYAKPDEDGYQRPFLKVKVNFKGKPKIYQINSVNKVLLDEETVGDLDDYVFEKADIKVRHAYLRRYDTWSIYLDKGFFTILEDDLDRAYIDRQTPIFDDEDDIPFM